MAKKVLITGATGLLGRAVVKAFEGEGWEVTGTGNSRAKPPTIRKIELADTEEVERLFEEVKCVLT